MILAELLKQLACADLTKKQRQEIEKEVLKRQQTMEF